ncbi:hypothetical protein D3C72_1823600 [compost metagenome]
MQLCVLKLLAQLRQLVVARHIQHAARADQGLLGKVGWRLLVKHAAGTCQCLYLGGAVMLFKQRGRTARGVIAGLRFALQHQHGCALCQLPGGGAASHAGTDDDEIPDGIG